MTSRKQLKIEAKQALETWSQTFKQLHQYPDELPQGKFDEFINLAIHSSGDIGDVLERMIQLMNQDDHEAEAGDMIELREELQTALKETLHFREQNTDYTRNQLFSNIGNLDELLDVNDLFNPSELDDASFRTDDVAIEAVSLFEADRTERHEFSEIEEENIGTIDLDDYLFDEEE